MKIILYVPGMPFDGNTISSDKSLGGSETAGYYLAKGLAKRGHQVVVFSNTPEPVLQEDVRYVPIGPANEKVPLGENFHRAVQSAPCDLLIAQRVPGFFINQFNSKLNFWWTHDLALKRSASPVAAQMWSVNRIMTVSDFHKKQIEKVYNIQEDHVCVVPNGIDFSLFDETTRPPVEQKIRSKTMIYSSRPERGLFHLVKENGIMEQLYKIDPEIKLVVCGYDNTIEKMRPAYEHMWNRCHVLPNVENYGALSKKNLAALMKGAWVHIYPTTFEEVSCITAMEAQAAGNPFLTTKTAALPETLKDAGVIWGTKTKKGEPNVENFVSSVIALRDNQKKYKELHKKSLEKAKQYSWDHAVDSVEKEAIQCFATFTRDKKRLLNHLLYHSDIVAAKFFIDSRGGFKEEKAFLEEHYGYAFRGEFQKFYDNVADYNTNQIKNNHQLGNDQVALTMTRLKPILHWLSLLPPGGEVLEYGCCVGQHTVAFARQFPHLNFTGVDISVEQVRIGQKFCQENEISNVRFKKVSTPTELDATHYDFVYCSEVLEHVLEPIPFIRELEKTGKPGARILFTTPHGPHEADRWDTQTAREHLHHFEEADIFDMVGNKPGLQISYAISGPSQLMEVLANYCFTWVCSPQIPIQPIDYERKFREQNPRESLSVCMIAKADGDSLGKTLRSIRHICDEIIIGVDDSAMMSKEAQKAWNVAKEFNAQTFQIESPIKTGFDVARNQTVKKAKSDWIMWIDDDEIFMHPEKFVKYLRPNQFTAYAIHQHHFTAEPAGLLKTDFPSRVFRNNRGIEFYGVVHEHPELGVNRGPGPTLLVPAPDGCITHIGYETEAVRRTRFVRNWPLMQRDREKYPKRELGQFLWVRDLAHINRFEFEKTQVVTDEMVKRGEEALSIWRDLVKREKFRLAQDSLPYVSECVDLLTQGGGLLVEIGLITNFMGMGDKLNGHVPTMRAKFMNSSDLQIYTQALVKEKTQSYEGQYV